jgi:FG-GAP-like repeat
VSSIRQRSCILAFTCLVLLAWPQHSWAYIGGPPATLGMMCSWSTHGVVMRIERIDKDKGIIFYRKVRDLKGKWPSEVARQFIAPGADRQYILNWAEPDKTIVMFALESYKWSHTYIDNCWFASTTADWQLWTMSHVEPTLLKWYGGKADKLVGASAAILGGREIVVPCMVGENPAELTLRRGKFHRLRASLKIQAYNPKEQFVAWGGDDFDALAGMPGFSQSLSLPRVGPDAQAISAIDIDGDGKIDLCLAGGGKVELLQNMDGSLLPVALPPIGGCRAAVWADYNGDGKPDLLLATTKGPRLFTNLGSSFRDDSHLLPKEASYNLTTAAWIDYDGDGRPDILLSNGYHGLCLYRNKGKAEAGRPQAGVPPSPASPPTWFEDVSAQVGLGPDGIGGNVKGDTLTVCDVNGDGRPDFLYGAGAGLLVLNTPKGFVEAKDSGISYQTGKVAPVFGDFNNDGHPDLFVPQRNGQCKLFQNDGTGHFTDVTARTGDLNRALGEVTCACWGDMDNDGALDLVIGCMGSPNRVFRNKGDGAFEDVTEALGLHKRIFNTQAVSLVDFNNDGILDIVFNNEGQDSILLLGKLVQETRRTPVALRVLGGDGVVGSRVRVVDQVGAFVHGQEISGGEGRGGQAAPVAHFALKPGAYRVEVRYSSGVVRRKEIVVRGTALRDLVDDRTARVN